MNNIKIFERGLKHGHSRRSKRSIEYCTWTDIKKRCKDIKTKNRKWYSDRGIKACTGWLTSFKSFLDDLGKRPDNCNSIDRINNDLGYNCGHCEECIKNSWSMNCRWSTNIEQANNKSINVFLEFNGKKLTIAQWDRELGLKEGTIDNRLRKGVSIKKLFSSKKLSNKESKIFIKIDEANISLKELSKITGLSYNTIYGKYKRGTLNNEIIKNLN